MEQQSQMIDLAEIQPSENWIQSQIPEVVKNGVSGLENKMVDVYEMDAEAFVQAYVNIVVGACISLGLRFAGTRDGNAQELLYKYDVYFLNEVMAGSGHLQTFKFLKFLRSRNSSDGHAGFGTQMAVSLAIGFLFIGDGMWTFSTSNSSIAALLITLYPRLPTVPNDNRCHLQRNV